MALAGTLVVNNPNKKVWTVVGLEADTSLTLTHLMASAPNVTVTANNSTIALAAALGAVPSSTTIVLTKQNAVGSAGVTPGTSIICTVVAEINPQG